MPLTDTKIRNAKPRDKAYKLYDGSGLYVLMHANGSRYWRLKYNYADKEKILALGVYPDLKLIDARERAQEARELVKQGIDPMTHKRETKARNIALALETFQAITAEWLTKNAAKWSSSYAEKVQTILAANVLPRIGKMPISTLTAPMVINAVRPMEARGAIDQAARAMRWAKSRGELTEALYRICAPLRYLRNAPPSATRILNAIRSAISCGGWWSTPADLKRASP
jgi:hypothetical protein